MRVVIVHMVKTKYTLDGVKNMDLQYLRTISMGVDVVIGKKGNMIGGSSHMHRWQRGHATDS